MPNATHTYLGNFPSNHGSDWTDALQGVAHDEEHWYFTQKTKILKFHVSTPLTSGTISAISIARMPAELAQAGGDHFGDPDHLSINGRGYLFVPVEGEKSKSPLFKRLRLAVFSTDGALRYIGSGPLAK